MTTVNPYTDDPDRAVAFELGYVWGFTNPWGQDNPPPYAQWLMDVYLEGVDSGRDDWARPPDGPAATAWLHWSELQNQTEHEWIEHLLVEGFGELFSHLFEAPRLGLAALLVTVLSLPGDTPLRPLPDPFELPYAGPEDDDVSYAAACPRVDHPAPLIGTTTDGFWVGTASHDFGAALAEAVGHFHPEALVARCSLREQTCGLVWAAR